MLQKPQDPDSTDADGKSPLMTASLEVHIEVVCLLLEAQGHAQL